MLHLLIQGCAVYQSINKEIHHHSILGMNHAFIHSPPTRGPVIYAGGTSAMAPPLPDFAVLLRPSKPPNRRWMEPTFCPLPDLNFSGRPIL